MPIPLHPRAIWFFFVHTILKMLVWVLLLSFPFWAFTLAIFFMIFRPSVDAMKLFVMGEAMITLLLFLFCSYIWARLTYRYYRYDLDSIGIQKEQGVLEKRYITIPYARIQNITMQRNIIEQLLGLATIYVETAGIGSSFKDQAQQKSLKGFLFRLITKKPAGLLPGLSIKDAENLHSHLTIRVNQAKRKSAV